MEEAILKKQVLSTVAYYNELDYPLTAFEIWKYRTKMSNLPAGRQVTSEEKISLLDIITMLESEGMRKWIENERGFYFLKGQKKLVNVRIERNKIANAKMKRLRRIVFWMRLVPFVRMIAVTGRLAMKNTEARSDWDLLIVLKSGRIWIGRTLVTLFSEIVGKRRKGKKIKDRICLNYFITDQSLEIKNKDLFSANEYSFLWPLFGEKTFREFQAKNEWLQGYKPNFLLTEIMNLKIRKNKKLADLIQRMGEAFFDWDVLEKYLGQIEKKKIEANPLTHLEGSFISANNEALIFLPSPQGPKIFESFKMRIEELILKN
jgi:hypothetical protein